MNNIYEVIFRLKDEANATLNRFKNNLSDVDSAAKRTSGGIGAMAVGLGTLGANAVMAVGSNLGGFLVEAGKAAQEAANSQKMFNFYMKELGVDGKAATDLVAQLGRDFGMVPASAQEAITALVKGGATMAQVTDALPKLAASAAAAGRDVNEAVVTTAFGIQQTRSELLEASGISANFGNIQQQLEKEAKKAGKALDEQAFMAAKLALVLPETELELKAYKETSDPATKAAMEHAAAQKNLALAVGQLVLPVMHEWTKATTGFIKVLTELVNSKQFQQFVNEAKPYINEIGKLISTVFSAIKTVAETVLFPALKAIAPALKLVLEAISSLVQGAIKLLKGDFAGAFEDAKNAVGKAVQAIVTVVKNLAGPMLEAGKDAVEGFINGIKQRIGGIVTAAQQIGQSAIDAVKKTLRIQSPSKEMEELGINTVQGFLDGLEALDVEPATVGFVRKFYGSYEKALREGFTNYNILKAAFPDNFADQLFERAKPQMQKLGADLGTTTGNAFLDAFAAKTKDLVQKLQGVTPQTFGQLDFVNPGAAGPTTSRPDLLTGPPAARPSERPIPVAVVDLPEGGEIGLSDAFVNEFSIYGTQMGAALGELSQPVAQLAEALQPLAAIITPRGIQLDFAESSIYGSQMGGLPSDLPGSSGPAIATQQLLDRVVQGFDVALAPLESSLYESQLGNMPEFIDPFKQIAIAVPELIAELKELPGEFAERPPGGFLPEPEGVGKRSGSRDRGLAALFPEMGPRQSASGGIQQMLGGLLAGALAPLAQFGQILEQINPIGAIVAGMMQALAPVIESLREPMILVGQILANLIMPVFQLLHPVLVFAAKVVGGFAVMVGHAWNAIAKLVEIVTFGAVKLYVNVSAMEESLKKIGEANLAQAGVSKEVSESMAGLPSGFKLAAYRYAASAPMDSLGTPFGPGQVVNSVSMTVVTNDPDKVGQAAMSYFRQRGFAVRGNPRVSVL